MKELYNRLVDLKIRLDLVGDQIEINAPEGVMTREILEEIKIHKVALVSFIKEYKKKRFINSAISAVEEKENYMLSHAQQRLWITCQIDGVSGAYNMPMAMKISISNQDFLEQSILQVVSRHESLRTVFKTDESGEVRQWILPMEELNFKINYEDCRAAKSPEEEAQNYIDFDAYKAFALENGQLLRVCLPHLTTEEVLPYFHVHPIISDGWSMIVLA